MAAEVVDFFTVAFVNSACPLSSSPVFVSFSSSFLLFW
jgi:hypothetical protein